MKSAKLTPKETEIMKLIAKGYGNLQIADILCNSIHTIRCHVWSIYQKLGLSYARGDERGALRVKAVLIWQEFKKELKNGSNMAIVNSERREITNE